MISYNIVHIWIPAKKLKVVSTVSVGFEHIDVKACEARGVKVGNTPDVLTDTTAELGCTLVLCAARGIRNAITIANRYIL